MRHYLLAVALCFTFAAPSFADPAITEAPVTMRVAPSGKSRTVQQIPASAEIDVSKCKRGWCYSSWRNRFGYIPAEAVVGGPPATLSGNALPPPVVDAQPTAAAPPMQTWSGPYVGFGWGYGWSRW